MSISLPRDLYDKVDNYKKLNQIGFNDTVVKAVEAFFDESSTSEEDKSISHVIDIMTMDLAIKYLKAEAKSLPTRDDTVSSYERISKACLCLLDLIDNKQAKNIINYFEQEDALNFIDEYILSVLNTQ